MNDEELKFYKNNAYCHFDLFIPSNFEVFITFEYYNLENDADFIQYFNNYYYEKLENGQSFSSYKNGTAREIPFTFLSDGSVS